MEKLIEFLSRAKNFSLTKKILLIVLVVIALVYSLTSCTSTRNVSVSVDKADKVNINMTDSITSAYPSFLM